MNLPIQPQSTKRRFHSVLILLVLMVSASGCVSRRLIIRTQPEGASVSVDGIPVGNSPVAVGYTYGGTRDIQIEKDGHKTVKVQQDLSNPWYLRPPVSFITENFSPVEIRHQPVLDFQLEPKSQINEANLLQRANTLRENVRRGTVTAPSR